MQVLTSSFQATFFCCSPLLCPSRHDNHATQMVVDVQQLISALPQHLLAVLLGSLDDVLPPGPNWAEDLTEVALSDSGPLEHVVRGVSVLVTLLEVLPKYRWVLSCPRVLATTHNRQYVRCPL